jgi:glutathione peroxidase
MRLLLISSTLCLLLAMNLSAATLTEQSIHALDGTPLDMASLKGKTVLVVNVASKCGFTKQYTGLQALYTEFKDRGFVILGVPSNDFGGQEPGAATEIAQFCSTTYGVDFPMTEKVKVKGPEKHPLYAFLTATQGEPTWNFTKYLVNKKGAVVQSFPSKTAPDSAELRAAIMASLAEP